MLRASFIPYTLAFRFEARTSRSVMHEKHTYFIKVWDDDNPNEFGVGECNLFKDLSADDTPEYESKLAEALEPASLQFPLASGCSSIIFGIETAINDLNNGGKRLPFPSEWTNGNGSIKTNGLVWMGDKHTMLNRIAEKINDGFHCLKLKIGGIDFQDELTLISYARKQFPSDVLEIRVDANGAFSPQSALAKIEQLAKYEIHSIEQPIAANQYDQMREICKESPIPVALDEELIGVRDVKAKLELLSAIRPQYIIIKPALCGGFSHSKEWTEIAASMGIRWWATSALESNIGLNAIAQWTYLNHPGGFPQGLGTGALYHNNIQSPLRMHGETLIYDTSKKWGRLPI